MYYIVYGFLYVLSLLSLRVLFLVSDLAYFFLYYVTGYRKGLVDSNLKIAFPEKTEEERKKIAKEFYLNFTDTFVETIKMISIGRKELEQRSQVEVDYINELIAKGLNIHIMAGHQFNWEFANLVYATYVQIPFVGIYMPMNNKIFDKISFKFRSRYGTIMNYLNVFKNIKINIFLR